VTVLAVARDRGGPEAAVPGDHEPVDNLPAAPWASTVPRTAVPPAFVAAWDRSANRATCELLFPLDGGPELAGANATEQKTPGDKGWDIFLTARAGNVEVLGLFPPGTKVDASPGAATFGREWADGSTVNFAVDVGNAAPGTYDPDASPFEAVLTVPGQSCAYRIYDTLGRAHLEALFDRLRIMRG
jgi:hypothetical protein